MLTTAEWWHTIERIDVANPSGHTAHFFIVHHDLDRIALTGTMSGVPVDFWFGIPIGYAEHSLGIVTKLDGQPTTIMPASFINTHVAGDLTLSPEQRGCINSYRQQLYDIAQWTITMLEHDYPLPEGYKINVLARPSASFSTKYEVAIDPAYEMTPYEKEVQRALETQVCAIWTKEQQSVVEKSAEWMMKYLKRTQDKD